MPSKVSRTAAIALLLGGLAAGCRIEDRTPSGSRGDDEAIRAEVAGYHRALFARDWAAAAPLFWDSALVQVRVIGDPAWRSFRRAPDYLGALQSAPRRWPTGDRALQMVRIDTRQNGDLASAWVVARRTPAEPGDSAEVEQFTLRRFAGGWRIVALAAAPAAEAGAR